MKASRIFTFALFVVLGAVALQAQFSAPATPIQQTATMTNVGTKSATTNGAVNVQITVSLSPAASNYAYITGVSMSACQNATGLVSALVSFNWTAGITGTVNGASATTIPVWLNSQAALINTCNFKSISFQTPLKSSTPGATVTLQGPAANADTAYAANVYWYEAP